VRNRSDGRLMAILPAYTVDDDPDTRALLGGDVSAHRGPVIRAGAEA